MRRVFGGALCAALIGGMALAAISGGATARTSVATLDGPDARAAAQRAIGTYRGTFQGAGPNSKIAIKATIKNREATKINAMTYTAALNCETSGPGIRSTAGWRFRGVTVNNQRRFSISGESAETPVSNITFKGRFSRNFKKVRGTLRTHQWFEEDPPLPAEYCTLAKTPYAARR